MKQVIIFTDLDGTLLDYSTYSFEKALPALDIIRQRDIPLILCSSKTRREIEHYREKLANNHPFVSENGGGIFIPKNYFDSQLLSSSYPTKTEDDYDVIRLGAGYFELRNAVKKLQREGFEIRGFGDMTVKELSEVTHLTPEEAVMAKERDFDEPFVYKGPDSELPRLLRAINQKGFTFTKGRFFHILGNSDKGEAVSMLSEFYKRRYGDIKTIALGDSPNDIPMLEGVDCPVLVQKPDGTYDPQINMSNIIKAGAIGPEGWNKVMLALLPK